MKYKITHEGDPEMAWEPQTATVDLPVYNDGPGREHAEAFLREAFERYFNDAVQVERVQPVPLEVNGPANIITAIDVALMTRDLDARTVKLLGAIQADARRTIRYMEQRVVDPKPWHEIEGE